VTKSNFTIWTLFFSSIMIQADIVGTETFARGDKTVYLLYDTHVSTPNAKLQAAAIDQALKVTKNVKFLVQQVEPIFDADHQFCSCLDNLNEIKFLVEADEPKFPDFKDKEYEKIVEKEEIKRKKMRKEIESKKFPYADFAAITYGPYEGLKATDHSYGVAQFLDSSDHKKFYINQLQDWIRHCWRFFITEKSLVEIVKKIDLKKVTSESWQTLVTNASLESFFYQHEVWDDLLENLDSKIKSEKNKEWLKGLNSKLRNKKKELKTTLKNDKKYLEKLNEIKTYEETSKTKFTYPKISDQFLIPDIKSSTNHGDILMIGIDEGVEAVSLSYMLDDRSSDKKVVLLASSFVCEKVKKQLISEEFILKSSEGVGYRSFRKVIIDTLRDTPPIYLGDDFAYSLRLRFIHIHNSESRRLSPALCIPFKD
jgi:hypothetical protein